MGRFTLLRNSNDGDIKIQCNIYTTIHGGIECEFRCDVDGLNTSIKKRILQDKTIVYRILPYNIAIFIKDGPMNGILRIVENKTDSIGDGPDEDYMGFIEKITTENFIHIKDVMERLITQRRMRNMAGLGVVEEGLGIPENIGSRIGLFLSGEKGSAASQMNRLRQKMGESLAPRAGGRRTRRRRRQ